MAEVRTPAPDWLTLCWNGRPLGRITEIVIYDWPWVCGRFDAGEWPSDLRAAIEWLAQNTDADDLEDPPYRPGFYDGWTTVAPDGTAAEIGVPKVDFTGRSIEWR